MATNSHTDSLVSFMDVPVYVFTLLMRENERSHDAVDTAWQCAAVPAATTATP